MRSVLAPPPRRAVSRIGELSDGKLRQIGGSALPLEAVHPLEPSEVPIEPPRCNAPEPRHEPLDLRVKVVDAAELAVVARFIRIVARNAKLPHGGGIGLKLVGGHDCAFGYLVSEEGKGGVGLQPSAPCDLVEHVSSIVDPGEHANLLFGDAVGMYAVSAMPCLARKLEGATGVVALEALPEERLVYLGTAAFTNLEGGQMPLQRLQDAVAHEPSGLQADAAPLGALAQGEPVNEDMRSSNITKFLSDSSIKRQTKGSHTVISQQSEVAMLDHCNPVFV